MSWAEQTATSIIMPSDVDTDNPDRNYIVIGADVPDEIAAEVQAGIVFHNVSELDNRAEYFVIGITKKTSATAASALEVVGYFRKSVGGVVTYNRQSLLTFYKSNSSTTNPRITIGNPIYGAGNAYREIPVDVVAELLHVSSGSPLIGLAAAWFPYGGDWADPTATLEATGFVSLTGMALYNAGASPTTSTIGTIADASLYPIKRETFTARAIRPSTGASAPVRLDVFPTGVIQVIAGTAWTFNANDILSLSGVRYMARSK